MNMVQIQLKLRDFRIPGFHLHLKIDHGVRMPLKRRKWPQKWRAVRGQFQAHPCLPILLSLKGLSSEICLAESGIIR
jgi:hypothetical protein